MQQEKTTGVYLCSRTNSTPFTDCCDVAVIDEQRCPRCGAKVYPEGGYNERFKAAYEKQRRGE